MVELTYGLELEWADVDRHEVPVCGQWSTADYTIVNSDGHANDPTGKTWRWGGELNTEPTPTIAGQAAQVLALVEQLRPRINYRCNLHVHVGLADGWTLDRAQAALRFINIWQTFLYPLIEPIPAPRNGDYATTDEWDGAMRRYRRRKVSHQHRLPAARVAEAMAATTLDGFYEAHAPLTKTGARAWHLAPRPGMNTRSIHKHGTLEFRHFPGSADVNEISDALAWCDLFVRVMFDGGNPVDAFRSRPWRFPTFRPYDHSLEMRYQETRRG